jgi:hypothetical protein
VDVVPKILGLMGDETEFQPVAVLKMLANCLGAANDAFAMLEVQIPRIQIFFTLSSVKLFKSKRLPVLLTGSKTPMNQFPLFIVSESLNTLERFVNSPLCSSFLLRRQ